ncbi:MAG TPA: formyltransferase family protein, partial [Caldimonas sp.]|nr:formyltransferase family protein [Caldimonas sp.]
MRILFLTRSFNSLAQRLWLALTALGHEVSIELDIADAVTIEAVDLYRPDLVIAPFLQRAIPEAVWRRVVCLVVHPGIVGDRGPSALDWAIVEGRREWGVTVLQANAEFDAGPVWASEAFAMRDDATKSCLYRHEVTEAASRAVLRAVRRFAEGGGPPGPDARAARPGRWHASMRQADRRIDWRRDDTRSIVTRIRAADGSPGVLDSLFGTPCHLYDAHAATRSEHAEPGTVIARRNEALLRATVDGAVWIGQARRLDGDRDFKLPATIAFPHESAPLPDRSHDPDVSTGDPAGCEIRHESEGRVAFLHFDFYNGAMSTAPCQRLNAALRAALARRPAVLVLLGGADFWSNGIHLHVIEAADSPADESMRNIEAMNDVVKTLIEATGTLIVAAMRGNAGAGGAFLALAADEVWARHAVILNPHYKN